MKTLLAGILMLVVAVNAKKPCQVPKRSVGDYITSVYNINTDKLVMASGGKMYYDENNKRIRVEGEHEGKKYTVLIFYKEAKQYVMGKGYCYAMPSKGDFKDMSIPDNAHLVNGGRIGTASNGLYINRYTGEKDGGRGIVTVTQKDCVISSSVALTKHEGANYLTYFSMTNVSLDFEENAFDKPDECHSLPGAKARRSVGGIWENIQGVIDSI
ncbi:uncharacterized protein LOC116306046 [Actinia tenebrosa]|uniref:Uncharacterized protein LOC116306046 n=1 Tax=Actinia tenebrosa TaxID=6105 RepID=A0A6P8IXN9_ACTTE|nr:uncharacterized protein LOC116306046 [Actinia tenebrosa]